MTPQLLNRSTPQPRFDVCDAAETFIALRDSLWMELVDLDIVSPRLIGLLDEANKAVQALLTAPPECFASDARRLPPERVTAELLRVKVCASFVGQVRAEIPRLPRREFALASLELALAPEEPLPLSPPSSI